MGITLDELDYNTTDGGAEVGSRTLAADGTGITATGTALDVNIASASGLGIYAEDSIHVTADDGQFALNVRLDARASTAGASGDYAGFVSNANGELYVIDTDAIALLTTIDADTGAILTDTNALVVDLAAIEVEQLAQGVTLDTIAADTTSIDALITALSQTEDAVSAGGEQLMMVGGYRRDADTSPVSADGDFHGFIFNATGELKTSTRLDDVANTSLTITTVTVPITAGGIALTAGVAGRRQVTLQNLGAQDVWVKDGTGVTAGPAGNGFKLPKNTSAEYKWGDNIDPFGITSTGTATVKAIEEV